ncbi:MAG: hypothetical protein PHN56_04235 [Candidatus Nanoarchaeia archaeon]|nr:hypothetical protein [Candidatus Nanoarchaeia archaeon]
MDRLNRDKKLIENFSIENLINTPWDNRWKRLFDLNPQINILDSPSQSYILNYFDKKIGLDMCQYFNINDNYKISCNLGKESQANCNGLNYNSCNWYNYQFLIDNLSKELNPNELNLFYELWITGISVRYTPKRIEKHLIKHLGENNILSNDWLVSAENLKKIYYKVKGTNCEVIKKYEEIIGDKKFDTSVKLEKLLFHYIKHFDISTHPPLKNAKEFKELLENKDFNITFFDGVSLKPFD